MGINNSTPAFNLSHIKEIISTNDEQNSEKDDIQEEKNLNEEIDNYSPIYQRKIKYGNQSSHNHLSPNFLPSDISKQNNKNINNNNNYNNCDNKTSYFPKVFTNNNNNNKSIENNSFQTSISKIRNTENNHCNYMTSQNSFNSIHHQPKEFSTPNLIKLKFKSEQEPELELESVYINLGLNWRRI